MQVSVYRYNPDLDEVPVMRDVEVELPEGRGFNGSGRSAFNEGCRPNVELSP